MHRNDRRVVAAEELIPGDGSGVLRQFGTTDHTQKSFQRGQILRDRAEKLFAPARRSVNQANPTTVTCPARRTRQRPSWAVSRHAEPAICRRPVWPTTIG